VRRLLLGSGVFAGLAVIFLLIYMLLLGGGIDGVQAAAREVVA